jgi:hypothetical protein
LFDATGHQFSIGGEGLYGRHLIIAHQSAVSDHIGTDKGGKFPFYIPCIHWATIRSEEFRKDEYPLHR